ncbi:MAG: AmmeMemoRadiSam system protein B [Synergistaceae bacterium]|nr:AmmeMemoRadiSam system protein B [Synergistaceae bacterium]
MNSENIILHGMKSFGNKLLSALLIFLALTAGSMSLQEAEAGGYSRSASSPQDFSGERNRPVRVKGGITPHHDVALGMIHRFYERIGSAEVRRVWLFSPDHFRRARTFAALSPGDWHISERILEADREACRVLASLSVAEADEALFRHEHGITIHIPLVARFFPNASVVPMVIGAKTPDLALIILKNAIRDLVRDGDAIILSMDLSHYKPPEAMAAEDRKTLEVLTKLRPYGTRDIDVDARRAAALVLMLFRDLGIKEGTVLEHSDSSRILGRRIESGTSYATILFAEGPHPLQTGKNGGVEELEQK